LAHCRTAQSSYTPSDFPLTRLTQAQLDSVIRGESIEDIYPLSPMQQGMLFETLQSPRSGTYINQICLEIEGPLDEEALHRAWKQVCRRHVSLRTRFVWDDLSEPVQVVGHTSEPEWSVHDWTDREDSQKEDRFEQQLAEDQVRGMDVGHAPLMRLALIRTGDNIHRLVWTHHHLIFDGWSVPIVFGEVMQLYQSYISETDLRLPHPRPYVEYIEWLKQQNPSDAEEFWRDFLAGFTAPTQLQADKNAGSKPADKRAGQQMLRLDPEASQRLKQAARRYHFTLNTLMQAAWGMLLTIYSGERDVIFGSATSGRFGNLRGIEQMVGNFINTLPVRLQVNASDTVLSCLEYLQSQQSAARRFEYSPLVQIQGWSDVRRGQPLFDNVLVFENYPVDESIEPVFGKARILRLWSREANNYALTAVAALGEGLSLQIGYDRMSFQTATIERMLKHWQRLIEAIVAAPETRIAELEMLTEAERRQILLEWNHSQSEIQETCIHQVFEEQVAKTPDALAVAFRNERLTYRDLNERSNQLAHYLRELGVGAEVRVGLCVERSPEMIVGLMGILKAGGVYVPLDPQYPVERIAFVLEDAQAPVVLTQERWIDRMPISWTQVLSLDRDWPQIASSSQSNPPTVTIHDNAAYVIYTSGSTGRPKGVVVTHQSVINVVAAQAAAFDVKAGTVVSQFVSIAFDAAISDWGNALLSGGVLALVPPGVLGADLNQWMRESGIQVATIPPGVLATMPTEGLSSLAMITTGGEKFSLDVVNRWAGKCSMINAYGPTECTVTSALAMLNVDEEPTIGKPIINVQVYVLDWRMNSVPVGVAGELYIGGLGVSRGYLNQPAMTAEKFLPNPFSNRRGERLYRTGDMGKWKPDGNLEYVSRADDQVKIRGYRIEPAEIEAVLRQHGAISEAVVIAQDDEGGQKRLVAYVVERESEKGRTAELREYLQERLPEYMVPGVYLELEKLPRTINGKIDRKALPKPELARGESQKYVEPRNEVEQALAGIWSEVLKIEKIGINDNFFDLGGHSLLATQVVAKIRRLFGVELELRKLFEEPTIAALANILEAGFDAPESGGSLLEQIENLSPEEVKSMLAKLQKSNPDFANGTANIKGKNTENRTSEKAGVP
jgi:amino acid adenylation domain-containing protein